jgi:hypothetical protein
VLQRPPPGSGERQRRYRQRQREGRRVSNIGADENSFLIDTRWLAEGDAADRRAVGCAIARAVTRN